MCNGKIRCLSVLYAKVIVTDWPFLIWRFEIQNVSQFQKLLGTDMMTVVRNFISWSHMMGYSQNTCILNYCVRSFLSYVYKKHKHMLYLCFILIELSNILFPNVCFTLKRPWRRRRSFIDQEKFVLLRRNGSTCSR